MSYLDGKKSVSNYHLLFIFLLSINYIFPLIIFQEITLFYHDTLDIEVVYNHILGKFYKGDSDSVNIFLAGEIKIEYLRRFLQPYITLYAIFNTELAYWITDVLVKLTAYFSFFLLSKKISNNILLSCLISCLFASINLPTHEGFGIAIFPYLIYLMLFKKKIKLKNYLIIIFFGLNSDIVRLILAFPIVPLVLIAINKNIIRENFLNILKIFFVFFLALILSNSNLIFAQLFSEPFHREEFLTEPVSLLANIFGMFMHLFKIPSGLDWTLFYSLPFMIVLIPSIILCFFSKNKTIQIFLSILLFIHFFLFLLNLEIVSNLRAGAGGLIKTFNLAYIETILPFLYALIFLYLTKENIWSKKYLIYIGFISILISQMNSSFTPIVKKYFLNAGNDYKNIYTFKGYYSYDAYDEIKEIVKNERVVSVGLDPMVAVMNGIKAIDGYHTLYPLSYKAKFRKIIKSELESNKKFQKYYDNWGSRVYAFVSDPNDVKINFKAAKDIGAMYVVSKFVLESNDLILECRECKNNLYLYQIK